MCLLCICYYCPFLYVLCSTVTVVIDGYTQNSILTSGNSVPLGTQIILVCWIVGLPYGTPLNYTWICPNGDCVPKVTDGSDPYNYGRKIYTMIAFWLSIQLTPIIVGHTPARRQLQDRKLLGVSTLISQVRMYCIIYVYTIY